MMVVAEFVKNAPNNRDQTRRNRSTAGLKVDPPSSFATPAKPMNAVHHSNPPTQALNSNALPMGSLFDVSELEDSDETAREPDVGKRRGYELNKGEQINNDGGHRGSNELEDPPHVEDADVEEDHEAKPNYAATGHGERETERGYQRADLLGRQSRKGFFNASRLVTAEVAQQTFHHLKNNYPMFAGVQREVNDPSKSEPNLKPETMPRYNHARSGRFTSSTAQPSFTQSAVVTGQGPTELVDLVLTNWPTGEQQHSEPPPDEEGNSDNSFPTDDSAVMARSMKQAGRHSMREEMTEEDIKYMEDRFGGSEFEESTIMSSPSQHSTRQASGKFTEGAPNIVKPANRKRAPIEIDYDETTLTKMNYAELKNQPFDSNPKASKSIIPVELEGPDVSLEDRLRHFAGSDPEEQKMFFEQMPIEEWDESGDWFLGRFGDITSKLKEARKAKRNISKAFEDELAAREEEVRDKADDIQEVMRQMRAGGEGVLKGRIPERL